MNEKDRQKDHQWLLEKIALEEERGSIVPGGAVGGAGAPTPRSVQGKVSLSAAMRARRHVRFLARAAKE